ncbi:MAG TPA: ATP cone domain-containing protein, partial [Clostridium sp.]
MLYVVKRDGRRVEFNIEKITHAIKGAAIEQGLNLKTSQIVDAVQKVITYIEMTEKEDITVEEI